MKRLLFVLTVLLLTGQAAFAKPADWSNNEWYQFFEQAVTTSLSEAPGAAAQTFGGVAAAPIVDVYSALSGIGSATKPALIIWLRNKRVSAELEGNTKKADLYQAYETALANDDSSRLKELLADYEAKQRGTAADTKAASATEAPASQFNLNGVWEAKGYSSVTVQKVRVEQTGNEIKVIKITGNKFVPSGRTTWYGTFKTNPFDGLAQWADEGYKNPQWVHVSVKVNDNDSITVQSSDSHYDSLTMRRSK